MRAVVWCFVVVVALASVGCRRGSDPHTEVPRVDARRLRNLHHAASRALACPAAALQARQLTDRVWQVSGCGQVREFAIIGRGHGRYRSARWVAMQTIAERASYEMACPPQSLTIAAPIETERTVAGCGRSASYAVVCGEVDCAWVMSGRAGAWAEPTPAPVPAATAQVVVVVDPAPVAPEVDGALRRAIEAQRATILACGGGVGPLAVVARWGADGAVTVGLGAPHAGSAIEACARAALGAMQVTTGAPGELIHVVR
ncbi:hypothetical protein [Sandaracinus amylolyticus]|uniref:hypothetical protein n=1 Tax=Sandaracinus amylolyticus TaxID=927083 RepID=UPI001F19A17D|nr:hypothetical protein [Sandaracinus amylolyticus]UJR87053.1 Hypothetical protein I5071_91540 [Sandaracinus amylolyticus]